jgi:hypothetical protein
VDGASFIARLTNKNTTLKITDKWSRYGQVCKSKITCIKGVCEKGVWRIFVCKSKEVTGGWRKMHNEELYRCYYLLNIAVIK